MQLFGVCVKDLFFSLGIILTFILSLWNVINNYRSSKRTAFINTVTTERIKWIENLRSNISSFCGLTYTWSMSELEGTEEEKEIIKEIDKLRHYIRLQLNPDPDALLDRKIEKLISLIPTLTPQHKQEDLKTEINNLITTSQELLKEEWEKVKEESKRGDLKDNEHCLDSLLSKINKWCLNKTKKS